MVNKTELLRELRGLTQAGMKDCKEALEETEWNLQKAVDVVKTKGLANTSRNAGKIAAEGMIVQTYLTDGTAATMVEVNCQTDFVAGSPEFKEFVSRVGLCFSNLDLLKFDGDISKLEYYDLKDIGIQDIKVINLEQHRKEVMASTKENIVVRRWWRSEVTPYEVVTTYIHSNAKLGVMASFATPDKNSPEFKEFADNVTMQIAAMNPIAVSRESLPQEEVDRQKKIFETQLAELNKPQAAWPKIMEGKLNKWYSEVCLLDQESVVLPKTSVKDAVAAISKKLGGEVKVLNFVRAVVGDGIEKKTDDLAAAVAEAIEESK